MPSLNPDDESADFGDGGDNDRDDDRSADPDHDRNDSHGYEEV